jgi:hypothetical protein
VKFSESKEKGYVYPVVKTEKYQSFYVSGDKSQENIFRMLYEAPEAFFTGDIDGILIEPAEIDSTALDDVLGDREINPKNIISKGIIDDAEKALASPKDELPKNEVIVVPLDVTNEIVEKLIKNKKEITEVVRGLYSIYVDKTLSLPSRNIVFISDNGNSIASEINIPDQYQRNYSLLFDGIEAPIVETDKYRMIKPAVVYELDADKMKKVFNLNDAKIIKGKLEKAYNTSV